MSKGNGARRLLKVARWILSRRLQLGRERRQHEWNPAPFCAERLGVPKAERGGGGGATEALRSQRSGRFHRAGGDARQVLGQGESETKFFGQLELPQAGAQRGLAHPRDTDRSIHPKRLEQLLACFWKLKREDKIVCAKILRSPGPRLRPH